MAREKCLFLIGFECKSLMPMHLVAVETTKREIKSVVSEYIKISEFRIEDALEHKYEVDYAIIPVLNSKTGIFGFLHFRKANSVIIL